MKTKITFLFTALLLTLFSINANAQSNTTPIKGDVNGDGKVDVADIVAIIEIMKNGGGTSGETIYYWYIGQTDPSTMTSISPIVTDNSSPGWRLIGTTLPTYSSSNMLWNGDTNNIIFENRDYYYIAVPNESIKIYNAANGSVMDVYETVTQKNIEGVTYYVYKSNNKARAFGYNIF